MESFSTPPETNFAEDKQTNECIKNSKRKSITQIVKELQSKGVDVKTCKKFTC